MKNTRYSKWVSLAHLLNTSGGLLGCAAFLWMAAPSASVAAVANTTPTVSITSPRNNLVTTNDTLTVTGKAGGGSTNDPLSQVSVTVNSGTPTIITDSINNWQTTVSLDQGTNVIQAVSSTVGGVSSALVTRTVILQVFTTISVQTNGNGAVTPNLNGKSLLVGKSVTLRAVPATDFIFNGWTGDITNSSNILSFVVQTNSVLVANFVPAPFSLVQGTYNGLITNDTSPWNDNSGFITLTATRSATYTARANIAGKAFPLSGRFDSNGFATLNFPSSSGLSGNVQLDMTNNTSQLTGTVSGNGFTSGLLADRAVFDGRTNLAPFAGSHNFVIDTNSTVEGFGSGTVTVSPAGVATMSGKLADGSPISQTVSISTNGTWPFFVSLYNGKGSALGFLRFINLPSSSISGTVQWFRPDLGKPLFAGGFTNITDVVGSLFIAPPARVPIMNWTEGLALVGGNALPMVFTNDVTFQSNNTITINMQFNGLKLTVDRSGLLHGSFEHPISQRVDAIQGALLPKTNWGGGFFVETNSSGFLFLGQDLSGGTNVLITPPATLEGSTLSLNVTNRSGVFQSFRPSSFTFTSTDFTSDVSTFAGTFNFSSAPASSVNVTELNLIGGTPGKNAKVLRMLLNFTDDTSGSFLEAVTAGGSGTASGTFTVTPPTPPPPVTNSVVILR